MSDTSRSSTPLSPDAERMDLILQKLYLVLTEILEFQMEAKEENLRAGNVTAATVELVI